MSERLQQLMRDHGFLDYDVIEFGEIVLKECLEVLDPSKDLTSFNEECSRLNAMRIIRNHFGV
jgi:hypothetical protein